MSTDLGEAEEGIVLAAAQSGGSGSVPEKNKFEKCVSCGSQILDIYCGNCGQKNDDLRRSLWRLIGESLGGIFSFESRVWRTWGALLLKPGQVARQYANGARTKYSPPIRIYLVVSFLFFAFLAIAKINLFAVAISPSPEKAKELGIELPVRNQEKILTINDFSYELLFFQSQSKFEEASNPKFLNLAIKALEKEIEQGDTDNDQVPIEGFKTFLKDPDKFNSIFNTWLPRILFFMVPIAMLLGAIFIRGPNALLYDHLIHAIYIHAMLFSAFLMAILLSRILSGPLIAKILIGAFALYLPLSLKHMFKRGWIKTIFTTIMVGLVYSLILLTSIIGLTVMITV